MHVFSDVWWGKAEPIYVTSYPRAVGNHKDAGWRFPKGATEGRCGEVSRIYFSNIKCTSENGIFVGGDTQDKVNHIYFEDVDLLLQKRTAYEGGSMINVRVWAKGLSMIRRMAFISIRHLIF